MRKTLTVKGVENAKPKAKRYFLRDGISPLSIRILPSGFKSCGLGPTRFPGSSNPTFRSWGQWDGTLEGHREKARQWLALVKRGIDPAVEVERERQTELRKAAGTFEAVAREYIAKRATPEKMSRWRDVKLDIERELIPRWGDRLIGDITRHDVILLCEDFEARGHVAQGHSVFGRGRTLYNWLIQRGVTDSSPFDRVEPSKLIGPQKARSRTLTDAEIRALWNVATKLPYPAGLFVKMLLITGQRRGEVAGMRWGEIDFDRALWILPPSRMKADRPHVVPLSRMVLGVLETVKRNNDRVFGNITRFWRIKQKIDQLMVTELKEPPPAFVLHDVRRTVRSRLSSLTSSDTAELIIAHSLQGLRKVYDHHDFLKEKTDALNAWANVLRDIIEPQDKVIALKRERRHVRAQ